MPQSQRPDVTFARFGTKDRGYGLGLHIVDTIVKRHGGTIEVQSKVGEGTTFTLRLPIEPE
jgi:signal transduction histidine kinase